MKAKEAKNKYYLWFIRATVLAGVLMFSAVSGHAQQGFGIIAGTVADPRGAAVTDAEVTIVGDQTGVQLKTRTNESGLYKIPSLLPGSYTVEINKEGFETQKVNGAIVRPDATSTVDVNLRVGKETISITVAAEGQAIDKSVPSVSVEMNEDLLENLPYAERSSLSAVMFSPEVIGNPYNGVAGVDAEKPGISTGYVAPGAALSIGGAMMGRSSIMVDGSDVTQTSFPRAGLSVSAELVGQTTVITSGLPAQYGRTMGGVMAQTTRSGTKQYHGALTFQYASNFMEANSYQSTFPTSLHFAYYGMYLGGPVKIPHLYNGKDKTFFFVGIEPSNTRLSGVSNANIPLDDELQGKFANSLSLLDTTVLLKSGYAAALAAPRLSHLYYEYPLDPITQFPAGARYSNSKLYTQIPNDDVSVQTAQNPLSQLIKSQLPTTANPGPYVHYFYPNGYWNNSGQNAQIYRESYNYDRRWSIRVDHIFSDRDRAFVRYSHAPLTQQRSSGLPLTSLFQGNPSDNALSHDVAANETHVFTSNIVNVFKAMYMRNAQSRIPDKIVTSKDWASQFNLPAPYYGVGFPFISLGYSINLGYNAYNSQTDQTFQIGDDLNWIHGRHMITVGLDLRLLQSKQLDFSNAYGGNVQFNNFTSQSGTSGGNSLAQLDLGAISYYAGIGSEVPSYYFWHYYGFYAQDSYRVRPDLTLMLGVRYEIETPRMEKFDNQGSFMPGMQVSLGSSAVQGAFCLAEACGLQKSLWPTNYLGIEPRIGLLWSPKPNLTAQVGYALLRPSLTGYSYIPVPNLNATATTVNGTTGGVNPSWAPNFITNPLAPMISAGTYFSNNPGKIYPYVPSSFGINYIDQSSKVPHAQTWNIGIQYQFKKDTLIKVGYNGLLGMNLISNYAPAANAAPLAQVLNLIATGANLNANSNNTLGITGDFPASKQAVLQESPYQKLLPYQNFFSSPLQELFNRSGRSTYNAMYASVSHRVGYGLTAQGSFTWSKAMDNMGVDFASYQLTGNTLGGRQNPYQIGGDRSLSGSDMPVRFTLGFNEAIPVGKDQLIPVSNKILDGVLGGWRVGGGMVVSDGWPIGINLGGSGWWNSLPSNGKGGYTNNGTAVPVAARLIPDVVPNTSCYSGLDWRHHPSQIPYLNPAHFVMPGSNGADVTLPSSQGGMTSPGTPAFGNARRYMGDCRSPQYFQFDASGGKTIRLPHHMGIDIGIIANNVLNHPAFYTNAGIGGTLYGGLNSNWVTYPNGQQTTNGMVYYAPFARTSNFGVVSAPNVQTRSVQLKARFSF